MFRRIFFISLLITFTSIYGQETDINLSNVTETVKLFTDRDVYFSGEELNFNADYFINAKKVKPVLSNFLYLELIEINGLAPIIQAKYKIQDFNAKGIIKIPVNVSSGNYILRAYTQYQRNFSFQNSSYCFLTILNPNFDPKPSGNLIGKDSIYIVAEGNLALSESKNKFVIKIPESLIDSANSYHITDESNAIIKELSPSNLGLMQTELLNHSQNEYKFSIITGAGDTIQKFFPSLKNVGFQTNVQRSFNSRYYKMRLRNIENNYSNIVVQLKVFTRDFLVKYDKTLGLNDSIFNIDIDNEVFEPGINYIVLFDQNKEILKVNTVFIAHDEAKKIDINLDQEIFKKREMIHVDLSENQKTNEELSNVSMAVVRHGTKIEDHAFLPSIYIKHPILLERFFEANPQLNYETQSQIMILFDQMIDKKLILNGISRKNPTNLENIPEVRGITIRGILRNKFTKEPVANHRIYLSVLFNEPQLHIYTTRENGEFIFSLNNLTGVNDIFLCPETYVDQLSDSEILIKSSFEFNIPEFPKTPIFLDNSDMDLIKELYFNAQLQQKFNKQNVIKPKREEIAKHNINDNMISVNIDDYIALDNMEELFFEIIPNVIVKKIKNQNYIRIKDKNDFMLSGSPLVLLDNIPIFNTNVVLKIKPSKIKKVEVIDQPYNLGEHTINGIIFLSSNTDNFAGVDLPQAATFIEYQTTAEEIDLKNQAKSSFSNNERLPDFRNTLYWNPQIDLKKESSIDFRASDRAGVYDIVVKAYNSKGEAFYGTKQIRIE